MSEHVVAAQGTVPAQHSTRRFGVTSYFALYLAAQERYARNGRLCNPRKGRCGVKRPRAASIRLLVQDKYPGTGQPFGDPYDVVVCRDHEKWWVDDDEITVLHRERLVPIDVPPPRKKEDGYTAHDLRRGVYYECNNGAGFGLGDENGPLCEETPTYLIMVVWADSRDSRRPRKGAQPWLSTVCSRDLTIWETSDKVVLLNVVVLDDRTVETDMLSA